MCLDLVGLQIHFRIENDKFLLLALIIQARKVLLVEVLLQCFVILKVLRVVAAISPVAKMASLMSVSAMSKEFVVAVESLSAKAALWMSLETALIHGARIVVSEFLMPPQVLVCE